MSRLTKRISAVVCYTQGKYDETIPAECTPQDVRAILNKLADYEDTGLSPEEINARLQRKHDCKIECLLDEYNKLKDKLAAYEDAEKQGRLIVLPCKVGDSIFRINEFYGTPQNKWDEQIIEWQVAHITLYLDEIVFVDDSDNCFRVDDLGKTVFLTPEEAEAALKEMKNDA